jgi:deubiquitinating protein VCIP135
LDSNGCIELCGGRELGDKYLQKLVSCMETVFREKNNVVTALVADVNQYVYKNAGGCTVYMYMYIHACTCMYNVCTCM